MSRADTPPSEVAVSQDQTPGQEQDPAPGWDALERAVAAVVPGAPLHWSPGNLPDQDGLYGIHAYQAAGCWLLVSLGLSELFGKVSDDPQVSGWGFELTLRVPRREDEQAPPSWALALLGRLGEYVFAHGAPFAPGHRMDPGGPITGRPDTRLSALAFTADPQLGPLATPNGRVEFLAVVGVSAQELAEMQATSTAAVLEALARTCPLLVTDPAR